MTTLNKSSSMPIGSREGRVISFDVQSSIKDAETTPSTKKPSNPTVQKEAVKRVQSAPLLSKQKSSRSRLGGISTRTVYPATEADMIEVYHDPEAEFEPDWSKLMTGALKRSISKSLSPAQRKNKGSDKCAEMILQHWLFLKKMQLDAENPYGVRENNVIEVPADLLLVSPTLAEYTDGLVTICKMKSGGVWDIDQKIEMLVGVYGRTRTGMVTREELAEILQKHAKVKPPPPAPHFDTEDQQIEYERKVKRGEIIVEKQMTQTEYELYLYRWMKKEWSRWPKEHGMTSLKALIEGLETNEKLCDHFSIDLMELMKDIRTNDVEKEEELKFVTISDRTIERYEALLEKRFPDVAAKKKREQSGDFATAMQGLIAGGVAGSQRRNSTAGQPKRGKRGTAKLIKKKKP